MSNWKFFLANSDDMSVNADITNVARSKQLALTHNRSGNCTFQLPLSLDTLNYTQTNQMCIIAMKNDNIVWSGPIWTRSIDLDAEKIDVSAVGWFEILMNRYLWNSVPDWSVGGENEGTIALYMLYLANTDHPTWITYGDNSATSNREIKYEIWQSIGEEIVNLSDLEDGFDIYLDPETRELNLHDSSEFADRSNIPFGMNWGPNNISNIVIEENGGEMRNRIQVVGSDSQVYTYDNATSQNLNSMLTEVIQITESDDEDVLQAIANAEGAIKEYPVINYEITLKPQGNQNYYEIFEDYNIGDRIYFTAQKQIDGELITFTHEPRIFGATIDIDDNGTERVSSLQTTFSG